MLFLQVLNAMSVRRVCTGSDTRVVTCARSVTATTRELTRNEDHVVKMGSVFAGRDTKAIPVWAERDVYVCLFYSIV